MRATIASIVCLLMAMHAPAAAQESTRRPRPYQGIFGGGRPYDPNRLGHEWSLIVDLLGSYDDATGIAGSAGPDAPVQPRQTGKAGFVETYLRYLLRKRAQSLEVSGRGFMISYDAGSPLYGGDARIGGSTQIGRRNQVTASQSVSNQPYLSLGEFGSLISVAGPGVIPESDPALGLAEIRSWNLMSAASVSRDLTTRQTTSINGEYQTTDFGGSDQWYDSRTVSFTVDHSWRFSRSAGLSATYNPSVVSFPGQQDLDTTSHSATVGIDYQRRLSPTREFSIGGDVGAMYVRGISPTTERMAGYWTPSAHANLRAEIGRSWSVNADYTRAVSVLDRVSVQTFTSDSLLFRSIGLLGRRLETTLIAALSRGRTPAAESATGTYHSYALSGDLRWAISRSWATTVSYTHYQYTLENVSVLNGLPSHSSSDAVRIGLTLWVPLYGTATQGAR